MDRSAWYAIAIPTSAQLHVQEDGFEGAVLTGVYGPFDTAPSSFAATRKPRWCVYGTGADRALSERVDAGVYLFQLTTVASREVLPRLVVSYTPVSEPAPLVVVAVPGDSLWRIGERQGVSLATLVAANPQIADPRRIHVGDRISIPRAAVNRLVEGTHDGATWTIADRRGCTAVGWARDPNDWTRDVAVRVLVDGTPRLAVLAGDYRQDLAEWFHDPGLYAFTIDLYRYLAPNVEHEIRIQAQDLQTGEWLDLHATPRWLTCIG